MAVAVGIPLLFWLAVELAANLGVLPLVAAAGLAAYLYTRETARETLAAGAVGVGALLVGLFALELYRVRAGGSAESLTAAVARLGGWGLTGAFSLAVGVWLYRTDFRVDH